MAKAKIAFQGESGANSEVACRRYAPDFEPLPCNSFELVFAAVRDGEAERAMIPVENSVAGRVSDIHHLLPKAGLAIRAEHFLRVYHQLLCIKGADPKGLKIVRSHPMALSQCRDEIERRGLLPEMAADTAGAARELADKPEKHIAVIAPELAAELYGLEIAARDIEDANHNTTRFLEMVREDKAVIPPCENGPFLTSFVFQVRNIPAALFKALGGFATNGVNMTKLESYQQDGVFNATVFYGDIEGHPDEPNVQLALEELQFFSASFKILGVYKADPYRQKKDRVI